MRILTQVLGRGNVAGKTRGVAYGFRPRLGSIPPGRARSISALHLDAIVVRVGDKEPIHAADFVFQVPFDWITPGFDSLGGGMNIADPQAKVPRAGGFGVADDQV